MHCMRSWILLSEWTGCLTSMMRNLCHTYKLSSKRQDGELYLICAFFIIISLKYFNTRRWRPVLPLGVAHATVSDDAYEDMYIPKGSTVYANTHVIHHYLCQWLTNPMKVLWLKILRFCRILYYYWVDAIIVLNVSWTKWIPTWAIFEYHWSDVYQVYPRLWIWPPHMSRNACSSTVFVHSYLEVCFHLRYFPCTWMAMTYTAHVQSFMGIWDHAYEGSHWQTHPSFSGQFHDWISLATQTFSVLAYS